MNSPVRLYVLHENPDWYAPLAAAFDARGLPHEQWLLGEAVLDLDEEPPEGVFWSRMSASVAHPRVTRSPRTRPAACWPGWSPAAAASSTAAGCSTWR